MNHSQRSPSLSASILKCKDDIQQLDKRLKTVCKAYLITSANDDGELGAVSDQLEKNFLQLRAQRERECQRLKMLMQHQNAVLADPDLAFSSGLASMAMPMSPRPDDSSVPLLPELISPKKRVEERRKLAQQLEVLDSLAYQLRQEHKGGANVRGQVTPRLIPFSLP
jgi:hypothetical protein